MSDEWYYAEGNQQQGPVTVAVLRQLLASGRLGPDSLVWTGSMPQWAPASSVPELAAAQPTYPPAQPTGYAPGAAPQYPGMAPAGQAYGAPGGYAPGVQPLGYGGYDYGEVRYAGFWLRVVAWFIDAIMMFVIGAILGGCIGGLVGGYMGTQHASPQEIQSTVAETVAPIGQLLQLIGGWLYFALMESSAQQATLGKMALGIRVTDERGQRIGFGRATGRYFAKFISALILGVGFLMAAFTAKKQALHDMIAGTLVVKK